MAIKNYYNILGLKDFASISDIKKAYRSLAFKYHPDQNKGGKSGVERFMEIKEAYETLMDPGKRSEFDAGLRSRNFNAPSYAFSRYAANDGYVKTEVKPGEMPKQAPSFRAIIKPAILVLITISLMYVLMRHPGWLIFLGTGNSAK